MYGGQNRSQKLVLRKYFSKPRFRAIINIINIVGIEYKELGMVLDDVNKLHNLVAQNLENHGFGIEHTGFDVIWIGTEAKTAPQN